jgi:DNA-binding NarL/FixJ family response regulator
LAGFSRALRRGAIIVSTSINVLISDGRKLFREALCLLLEKQQDMCLVGQAEDMRSVVKLTGPLGVHVVVLLLLTHPDAAAELQADAGIPNEAHQAAQIIKELRRAQPQARVIVVAASLTSGALRDLLAAGTDGCVTMECAAEELVAAVRAAAQGRTYLSSQLTRQVAHGFVDAKKASRSELPALAARETEVLRRIAAGQSTKEIAYSLHVGTKTVETHRRRVMDKLNRHSVAELTQYAIVKGLIPLPRHSDA